MEWVDSSDVKPEDFEALRKKIEEIEQKIREDVTFRFVQYLEYEYEKDQKAILKFPYDELKKTIVVDKTVDSPLYPQNLSYERTLQRHLSDLYERKKVQYKWAFTKQTSPRYKAGFLIFVPVKGSKQDIDAKLKYTGPTT